MASPLEILENSKIIGRYNNGYRRFKKRYFAYKINAAAKVNAAYSRLQAVDSILDSSKKDDLVSTLVFAANDDYIKESKAKIFELAKKMIRQPM